MAKVQFKLRTQLSFLFLVGMFILFPITSSFAFNFRAINSTIKCIDKERKALLQNCHNIPDLQSNPFYLDCCNWRGVHCNAFTGRIYRLDYPSVLAFLSNFICRDTGFHFGPSLLALEDLLYLYFNFDDPYFSDSLSIPSSIPSFIGSFPKLRYLKFSDSWFTGALPPQLGNLTSLQSLEIHQYFGEGMLRSRSLDWLSHLTSLKKLVLDGIDLSEARDLIHVVSNLPSLILLDLHNSRLAYVLPPNLSSVNSSKSLAFVDLSYTFLKSSLIWTWLSNHSSSLVELYLNANELTGLIPYSLTNMTSLTRLDLSSNQLEGEIQDSIRGLCRIQSLDLSQNNLMGDITSVFRSLSCAEESLTNLAFGNNNFTGSLPDITSFSSLKKLSLQRNNLDGSLPLNFANPSSLRILNLQHNQLTGSIPDLSSFGSLKKMHLKNNQLNGSVHISLGQLSNLHTLDISSNSLKGNILAGHFVNLLSLRYLDMSFNSFTFNLDSDWVPPFRLQTIGLASCKLGPRFPKWLRTQRDYSRLDVSNTGISDTIPYWFWNLSSTATFIGMSHNGLHGILPNSSIGFSENPAIDLSSNHLKGTIPTFFANTIYLNLSRNSFSGSISFLCHSAATAFGDIILDLSHNFLSGKLPDCWTKHFTSVLDLSSNNFSGNFPSSFGSLNSLRFLHLKDNKFSGKLPLSFSTLTRLTSLDLGDNSFNGEIPTWIGHKLPHLTVLSLRNNFFFGRLPLQLCKLSSIQILDVSMNNINGTIPHCLYNLTAMTQRKTSPMITYGGNGSFSSINPLYQDYMSLALKGFTYEYKEHLELVKSIDLSSNRLNGPIPAEISCLNGLVSLNLSRNNLNGSITPKISQLKSLESLDLSNNHLSGAIPSTFSELSFLGTLNLANNNLSGRIPTGTQLQGFNASVFVGNPRLCGDPLPKCIGDKTVSKQNEENQDSDNDSGLVSLGFLISVVLGFITGFWGVCGILVLNRSWRCAFFGFWSHLYDKIYVLVALLMVAIRR
ncbi:receptor-like protein EIX2 [Amaranthus tricolor]|uniref:receptor-like protein EIX2 n=1 Tax=Amaranthus tricolor TaxID=29722 RepID=UPI00258EFDA5|nr:receptor-like protein EIX2 [Amaranthus tricolor]